jgi:hypothetical protein
LILPQPLHFLQLNPSTVRLLPLQLEHVSNIFKNILFLQIQSFVRFIPATHQPIGDSDLDLETKKPMLPVQPMFEIVEWTVNQINEVSDGPPEVFFSHYGVGILHSLRKRAVHGNTRASSILLAVPITFASA